MEVIITILNNELKDKIIEIEKATSKIHKKIVKSMLKETILCNDPLTLKIQSRVRGNLHLTFIDIRDDFIKKGYKDEIDFKMEIK